MAEEKITELINENPNIIRASITEEMEKAYLDYAMSVIVSRALPDVRDGLKPVQRRIIYAMQDQNMTASGKFNKSASVVGEVLKSYHPHGDTSVYDALVRMAQPFSLRYPLIIPQGNFGNIDGDGAAAMRYTECKMSSISEELYRDIDKETVTFEINDLQNMEPMYLPSVLPNILLNGATGIAVGMATNIPPHNLNEVIDGITMLIDNADEIGQAPKKEDKEQIAAVDFSSAATVEDLIEHIKGPDFPTGGIIYDRKELMQLYATGKGRVVTRAKLTFEEDKKGRSKIIVTEIPYQVNKSTLVSKIAENIKKGKIDGVSDLRDESNRNGMRIAIELKKEAIPKKVENQLYKFTQLQDTFNANMVVLVNGEPKLMTLKSILQEFIKHRQLVVVKRTIYLLKRAREREHILLGLKIALDNLDEVIKLIRSSADVQTAKTGLMENFDLSEIQAQAILDMQLRRLAALERKKIEDELKEIMATIEGFETLLASPKLILNTVREELVQVKEKYGDERKTKVIKGTVNEISDEDLVVEESCIITISNDGYIKRLKEGTYKIQHRGGKGVKGQTLKETDAIQTIKFCSTHDYAFFFTNTGKVYKMRIWEIPELSRTAKGTALVNFLSIKQDENIHAFLTMGAETLESNKGFIALGTKKGRIKKTAMEQFENIRSSGIMAIKMNKEDELVWARLTSGEDHILMTTAEGKSIRFKESDVREMGRTAKGVIAIKLKKDDVVVGMTVIEEGKDKDYDLIVVSEKGYGKKTGISGYKVQNRGGTGILTYKVKAKTGNLITARVQEKTVNGDVLIATNEGQVIKITSNDIPRLGRDTQGVKLISLNSGDKATSVAVLSDDEESGSVTEDEE